MLRPFPLALDLGAYHGLLGRKVAELPSVGAMIYAESAFAFAASCPRPALVCDEDLLPFKDGGLNLIVSGLALHRVNDLPGALDPDQARACARRTVHGGAARRRRAVGAARGADRGRGRDRRRSKPAGRPVRRCARLWRVVATRGLRAAGGRRRGAHGALSKPPRGDARDSRARRRQCAARPQQEAASTPHAWRGRRRSIASATAQRTARCGRASRSSISAAGGPTKVSRSRSSRAAPRSVSPMRSAPPNSRPVTRRPFPARQETCEKRIDRLRRAAWHASAWRWRWLR